MAADQAEIHRDRCRDCVEKEEDGQFQWEEWDWESMVDEVGSAREAFEPRGSKVLRRQDDGQDEGGKRQEEVVRRQDEGGRMRGGKRQDDGDGWQYEDEREKEGDMQQEGDNRCRGARAQNSDREEIREDRDEIREEMEKGVRKGGEQVNLEDRLRRFKQAKRATTARRQGRVQERREEMSER